MEMQSPPKRMTRARAAAKASTNSAAKTTKVAAASSKPSITRATTSTNNKRKTRSDDTEDHEEFHHAAKEPTLASTEAMNKTTKTRGRPKKAADSTTEHEPEQTASAEDAASITTTTRATRGRAKKATVEAPKPEPVKTTRTRAKKTEETAAPVASVKKTTRTRAASTTTKTGTICTTATTNPTPGLKSAVSRPASRIGVAKKSVTFQEPEKENLVPIAATKAKGKTTEIATGLRAKPVRKAATGGRTTRASTRTTSTDEEKPAPLSPKKDGTNRSLSRDASSDDELATLEKTPLKPMMKSPIKPPSSMKPVDLAPRTNEELSEDKSEEHPDTASASVFDSPARRPPASPWKDSLKSPAKRVDGVPSLLFPSEESNSESTQSLKSSLLQSPAKRPQMPIKSLQPPSNEGLAPQRSPLKMSLLQSPAKRPVSPLKIFGSPSRSLETEEPASPTRKPSPAKETARAEEVSEPVADVAESVEAEVIDNELEVEIEHDDEMETDLESPALLEFPGRLSAVLPRHADPALRDRSAPLPDQIGGKGQPTTEEEVRFEFVEEQTIPAEPVPEDPIDVDEMDIDEIDVISPSAPSATAPAHSPVRPANPMFGLRQKDLVPFDNYDSEDELASGEEISKFQDDTTVTFDAIIPATPTPAMARTPRNGLPPSAIKAADRAIRSVSRGSKLGFTPLARQLSEWRAGSPSKEQSPAKGTFFDDEMQVREDMAAEAEAEMMAALEADIAANYDEPVFDDVAITSEDVELAAEANEMSLLEPAQIQDMMDSQPHDDSGSEASQEYGDENAVPIDPALLGPATGRHSMAAVPPVTPMRPTATRTFHTTTKVPLKPADDSTPRSMKRRSASVSRLPIKRPTTGLTRNATVISYSPTTESNVDKMEDDGGQHEQPPTTPAKSDIWSSMGTPARTPRRDLNPALLRGAVVFVDVHTSEGADASTVFVDLLSQMGARCVKSWPWNPTSPTNGESSTSKIGITHVVFKDGGKRTMEKVRESGGVVQCVGVGWVLDCERENEWLDEAPYYIDTSLVPRGGQRRRKSMEPKALANLNGTLVTPMKQMSAPSRECQTVPYNHMSRRDSTVWMRTPSDRDEDEDMENDENYWDNTDVLTPIPKTPAPETIARFAMDVTPETPTNMDELSMEKEELFMRTAPPKQNAFVDLGEGVLGRDKDQHVLMRLMAARRKSLQFAPKVASPLSRAWN